MGSGEGAIILVLVGVLGSLLLMGGAVFVVLLVRGTEKKTRMGINLKPPTNCPVCAMPLPQVRIPRSLSEFLWGGWTCKQCDTALDKWGRHKKRLEDL